MRREGGYFSKDEMIRLHKLIWKIKENLESSGLKFDLKEYRDFGVYIWRIGIISTKHWHAINMLTEELSKEAVRILKLKM